MYQNPENLRFGGGADGSMLHPAVMVWMVITIILLFTLPRQKMIVPFLLIVVLGPFGQQLHVGVHLFVARILIFFAWIRIVMIKAGSSNTEIVSGGFNGIDKLFVWWAILRAIATCLTFLEMGAIINQVAFLWDTLGGYFLFRFLIRDKEDIVRVMKTFAVIVAILSVTMINEQLTAKNVFGYIGGRMEPFLRDGKIRAQGPFTGPIPAGTFGATLLCLFIWLWTSGRSFMFGFIGVIGSTVMMFTSQSSTPLMAFPAGILGISFWPFRQYMRPIRWAFSITLLILHMVMKAPVWMLINHIDMVGGNSSYHRAMLIDGFVTHFKEWWLIGVASTANWGWDMWDQANQFVQEGENGGLATVTCFIMMVSRCFGRIGKARKLSHDRKQQWSLWLIGAGLFAQVVAFFGISFSDQSIFGWYALLAIIITATEPAATLKTEQDALISNHAASSFAEYSFPVGGQNADLPASTHS